MNNNFRLERIEKLMHELRHEITRGIMENEIEETMTFNFVVPVSRIFPKGCVCFRLETRPMPTYQARPFDVCETPELRVIKRVSEPRT